MKRFFRSIFALLILSGILSWLAFQTSWGQNKLKRYAENSLSQALEAKTKVGSVDFLFPFFIKLHDIDVAKEHASVHIDSFSFIPFWLDLPFKRITLFSAVGEGIQISGDHPEELLESSQLSSYALSIFYLHLQSLQVAHEKIPGKEFDGSFKGRLFLSSTLDHVKINGTFTRAAPAVWPRHVKFHFSQQNSLLRCSGSLFLDGLSPFFGQDDYVAWEFSATKGEKGLQDLNGTWNIRCPTTEIPLINNFVVNRMVQAHGSLSYVPEKELAFSCDDFLASMVFGKNMLVHSDIEGGSTTLMQYGAPVKFHAKMSLQGIFSDQSHASIRFLAPSFSCNSFSGTLQGGVDFLAQDKQVSISSNAEGVLLSEAVEVPIHFLGDLKLDPTHLAIQSDLLAAPFHLTTAIEKKEAAASLASTFQCQDLSVLQKYLPVLLSGSGEISFSQIKSDSENSMNLSSHFSHAHLGSFSCKEAHLSLSSQNPLSKVTVALSLESGKSSYLLLDKAHIVLEVAPKTQELYLSDLRMSGKAAALPFDIRGSGIGKFDSLQSYVTLTDLQGTLLKENLSLERPVKVECIDFGELFSLADFSLIVGEKGTLKGQWIHPSPSRSTLELTWRNLPFPIMAALTGIGSATGVMSGECHYQTTPRDAVGSFQMQAAVSRCGALGCPEGSLEITTEMSLAHLALTGNLSVTGTGVLDPLECSFSLPVIRQPKTPVVYLSTNEPITASLNGSAQISKLFYYWMPEEIGCEAILAAHTKVTGTLGDIKINGPVSLREGRMELLATGQTLESIEMDGQMHGRTLSINTISASDLAEGTLSGTGVMNFFEEGEFLWKLFLTCKDLEVVNLPYTNAVADAILTLDGTTHSLLISGNGTAKKAFVDVAARFPANIPELPVTFTGEKKEDGSFFVVNFDLHLEAPSGGEIRGRGLRTDWKGHAYLSGPATKLCLAGLVECTKGTFTLAGKELTISQGSIAVAGNLFRDSRLNVLANVSLPAITVQVGLKGSLKDPKFFIQSIPILPEKEVLSLLLFNKEYGDISPLESLQLANAAMTLQQSSGPFDLIDHVKTTLGIDLIDIGSSQIAPGQPPPWSTLGADNEDNEGMVTPSPNDVTLKVGKYISDGVAITVSKDVTAGVNRVGLEASLSQHVTADAEIGDDAGGIASLKWKKDY